MKSTTDSDEQVGDSSRTTENWNKGGVQESVEVILAVTHCVGYMKPEEPPLLARQET